jgi:GH15 family glucan-1,4-alpha-glucosidase
MARHYDRTRDLDFIRAVYKRLVVQPAEFLVAYRDAATNLPLPSHDIWEERLGVFTFTASAVCAALNAAAQLANLFNEQERRTRYLNAATAMRDGMVQHLWLEDEARFARGLVLRDDDSLELDRTVDASTFATFYLDVFDADTAMVESTIRAMREKLWVPTEIGGLARYENDAYQKRRASDVPVPGNPWIICTLWLAEHAIARATRPAELRPALDLLRWVRAKARPSLVLPEQVHPHTGAPLSVAPFSWSHAQTISAVRGYLDALRMVRPGSAENGARTAPEEPPPNSVDNLGSFS